MTQYQRLLAFQSFAAAILMAATLGCASSGDDDDGAEGAATNPPITGQATIKAPAEVEAGKKLVHEGEYEEAINAFTSALEQAHESNLLAQANEDEAEVYLQRGIAYLRSGFPDTAVQDFDDAINLMPNNGAMYEQRAQAYLQLGDAYNALNDATQAIRLKPDNAAAYHIRGEVYLLRDRPERAVADLEQALKSDASLATDINPQLAKAYSRWSEQLRAKNDAAAADEKLAKAREIDPTLAAAVAEADQPPPAAVEQIVAKPVIDDSYVQFQSGREKQLAGDYDQAIIDYTEAIALRSDFEGAYMRRGETLLAMGFPDSALEDLRRASNRGAASAEVHRLEARAHMALKNPNRAAMSATVALQVDPTNADTYALRGEAYLEMENWDRAVGDLEEAIRRAPELRASLEAKLIAARRELAKAQADNLQASAGP